MIKRIKKFQLWLHHHYDSIRNWLLITIGAILLFSSMMMIANQNRLINQVKDLADQNKTLNEQNNQLSRDNQQIAKQNRAYTKCIATVFAQYTHDFVPVTIVDLDSCTVESQSGRTQRTTPSSSAEISGAPIQPSSASPSTQEQPEQPEQPQEPSLLDNLRDMLNSTVDRIRL